MWKRQIMKGDDFEEWGSQLKEKFAQIPSHQITPSPPSNLYPLSIHHSSIPFHKETINIFQEQTLHFVSP